jgi:RNA polymerase sigma factor (sigma-70 family)
MTTDGGVRQPDRAVRCRWGCKTTPDRTEIGSVSDQQLVRDVYDASYRRLVVQMLALCGDQAEAEDAVQEAFVKAISSSSRFARLDNPEAWLRTVALNQLRNRWRHTSVVRRVLPKLPGSVATIELSHDRVAVVTALGQIPFDLRVVVTLHHIADQPTAQVARELGIPEGTVKARLVKGRSMLAALLSDEEESNHV